MLAGPEHVPGQPAILGRPMSGAGAAPETELERRTRELQVCVNFLVVCGAV